MKFWNIKENAKILPRVLACGFLLTLLLGWLRTAAAAEQLPESVLRLHVVANSDSPEDQALKLAVRDAVLEEAARYCAGIHHPSGPESHCPVGGGGPGCGPGDGAVFPHQGV